MPLKVDLLMSLNGQTFSETHYWLAQNSIPIGIGTPTALAQARAACLGAGAQVTGLRISLVPANRLVQDQNFNNGTVAPSWPVVAGGGGYDAATPNNAILLRLNAADTTPAPPKALYLAAPPTKAISTIGGSPLDLGNFAAFNNALGYYMTVLTGNAFQNSMLSGQQSVWGYRALDNANLQPGGMPVTNSGFPGLIGIPTVTPLPGIPVGLTATGFVHVKGFKRLNPKLAGLQGTYQVVGSIGPTAPATAPYIYFLGNTSEVPVTNFVKAGSIAPLAYKYVAYSPFWSVDKAVTRKRGESIGARRGRLRIRA